MQTQSYFLKRKGFALITAVFLLIIISAMLVTMLSLSTETTKRTANDYLNEQAILLAYGATEQAVLSISGSNLTAACPTAIGPTNYPAVNPILTVTTTMRYIWANGQSPGGANCNNYIDQSQSAGNQLTTIESNGAVVIDVTVQTVAGLMDEPVTFHRRTLQKL